VDAARIELARLSPADFTYHYSFHYQISLFVVWTMPSPYLLRFRWVIIVSARFAIFLLQLRSMLGRKFPSRPFVEFTPYYISVSRYTTHYHFVKSPQCLPVPPYGQKFQRTISSTLLIYIMPQKLSIFIFKMLDIVYNIF